jgi:hypothetical protein
MSDISNDSKAAWALEYSQNCTFSKSPHVRPTIRGILNMSYRLTYLMYSLNFVTTSLVVTFVSRDYRSFPQNSLVNHLVSSSYVDTTVG